ncbi:potential E3 ubiquitin-protein ligase ariadne-2 [Contarinia nasturtii]|uniref:potential E3 ubiquitin-protein ligase ariadne-2 n=1 Tax=Contarinia nasturtii TaxID=265458 RepID=UPI0012D3FF23|nr:potential E3 ubiquitin-protein ligase ariadne-2 [Contarinia nasturtii]
MSDCSDMEYSSDNECEYDDYYNTGTEDIDIEHHNALKTDPESFEYDCLSVEDVDKLLNESIECLCNTINCAPSLAKTLLLEHRWSVNEIVKRYRENPTELLTSARIRPLSHSPNQPKETPTTAATSGSATLSPMSSDGGSVHSSTLSCKSSLGNRSQTGDSNRYSMTTTMAATTITPTTPSIVATVQTLENRPNQSLCSVCAVYQTLDKFHAIPCGHSYCRDCWSTHFETQINQGISTGIDCMATQCNVLVPEDLVLTLLCKPHMRTKYQHFAFQDYVKSHPELRFCPGPNCQVLIRSKELSPKKATCDTCKTVFCFLCGMDYHAPTDCKVIKKWLTKCADDSETANYISAHTKDCPKCHICIEKNGGCNHMQCFSCKHNFCWMCLGDWKSHGSEYYECSRYKENPNIAHESVHAQAREALKKYLHYYERWENHSKSFQLEQQTLDRLKQRINEKVMKGLGTWIDWQYLFTAAALLAKCRYTLQYTYPYAYFMESGPRKSLFEYQQARLESEIENLSWKFERAETTDRADLENQMDIAEKLRITLLKDFFATCA